MKKNVMNGSLTTIIEFTVEIDFNRLLARDF